MEYKELPIKIQTVVFKKDNDGKNRILLLKRTPEDGGFWQTITGTLEENETIKECKERELLEETGISVPMYEKEIGELYRFSWQKKDYTVVELVYGLEVKNDVFIEINPKEHTEYQWATFEEAVEIVEKENTKNSIRALIQNYLMQM